MTPDAAGGWKVFEPHTPVLTYTYSFGLGTANALAVGGERGLLIASPPYRAPAHAFELRDYAPVAALIASNAFHHMGLPEWSAHFPDTPVFAPAQSVERVSKKSGIAGIRPLAAAAAIAGSRVELVDMPFYRTGEALVRMHTARGLAWYVTDIILNVRELPRNVLLKLLYQASGSVPGLRFNRIGPALMVRDRRALRQWLKSEFERAPPRWIIPTHGEIFDCEADPDAVRALFSG